MIKKTLIILISLGLLVFFCIRPSNKRDWNIDQAILSKVIYLDNDKVLIKNIRNFNYTSTSTYDINYYDKEYDTNKLLKAWYIVEPFSGIPGSAHTFLSFEFENDVFIAFSVEIRKEKGEDFHPVKGLFKKYEIMYVVADEKDVIKLRSNYRNDKVYVYPARADKLKLKSLFNDILKRVNDLNEKPEFYNTLFNTCTSNIQKHINNISPKKLPKFSLSILFPEYSDKLAYDLNMIDTDLSFDNMRNRFLINDRALKFKDAEDFSRKIRE